MPLQGELIDFPIEEIITLLNEGKKSGALEIEYEDDEGVSHKISIFFKNGEVVYATDGVKIGIDVLETVAKLFNGKFIFVPGEVSVQDEEFKKYSFREFKDKLKSIIDKWKPLKEAFPSLNDMVYLSGESPEKLNLHKNEWAIISAIGGGISIRSLLDKLNISELTLLETLLNLKNEGVITVKRVERVPFEILHFVPKKVRGGVFSRQGQIEDEVARKLYELIDGEKTLGELSELAGISPFDAKEKIEYLASLNRVVKPPF